MSKIALSLRMESEGADGVLLTESRADFSQSQDSASDWTLWKKREWTQGVIAMCFLLVRAQHSGEPLRGSRPGIAATLFDAFNNRDSRRWIAKLFGCCAHCDSFMSAKAKDGSIVVTVPENAAARIDIFLDREKVEGEFSVKTLQALLERQYQRRSRKPTAVSLPSEMLEVPDWILQKLPPSYHVAFARNMAQNSGSVEIGQPVKGVYTLFYESGPSRPQCIKLQVIVLDADAVGEARLWNSNVGSKGNADIASWIFHSREGEIVSEAAADVINIVDDVAAHDMIVVSTAYGEPLLEKEYGHTLRNWLAVEVESLTQDKHQPIEYFFAVGSDLHDITLPLAVNRSSFEAKHSTSGSMNDLPEVVLRCFRHVAKKASRRFGKTLGSEGFLEIANRREHINWQVDYRASQLANVAYVIEAPLQKSPLLVE